MFHGGVDENDQQKEKEKEKQDRISIVSGDTWEGRREGKKEVGFTQNVILDVFT